MLKGLFRNALSPSGRMENKHKSFSGGDWCKAVDVTKSEIVLYVSDADFDAVCQCLMTFGFSPLTSPSELDIPRKAVITKDVPMSDHRTSHPDEGLTSTKDCLPSSKKGRDIVTSSCKTPPVDRSCGDKSKSRETENENDFPTAAADEGGYKADKKSHGKGKISLVKNLPIKRSDVDLVDE